MEFLLKFITFRFITFRFTKSQSEIIQKGCSMAKNIEMNYKQGESEYEVLYPNVKVENVIDIEEHYYTKDEVTGQISDIIPNPYGVLAIKATDDEGNPVSVQLTVNPQIDGSSTITTDSGSGLFVAFVNPATYNLTAPAGSDFIEYNIDVPSAQVKTNQVTNVNVGVNVVQSGELEITSSRTIQFPANFNIPVDIWGCGGGGGGSCSILSDYNDEEVWSGLCGATSGYTFLNSGVNVSNKSLQITIGSGGKGETGTADFRTYSRNSTASNGGQTKITNAITATANGGKQADLTSMGSSQNAGLNGGTGGGGLGFSHSSQAFRGKGTDAGTDGGNAPNVTTDWGTIIGGKGQGTTTRKFSETSGTLYCDSCGGMVVGEYGNYDFVKTSIGASGPGAGTGICVGYDGEGDEAYRTSYEAGDATTYGSAGGSIVLFSNKYFNFESDTPVTAGNGKQGVVFIRWPSQST